MNPQVLRTATADELAQLTELCLRSKAHWGYPPEVMALWHDDLTVSASTLARGPLAVLRDDARFLGLVQVVPEADDHDLHLMFIDPDHLRRGYGERLFRWAVATARNAGGRALTIESEPAAAGFYQRMGARQTGWRASNSIPGRRLPLLRLTL